MDSDVLAALIKAKADEKNSDLGSLEGVDLTWLYEAVAEAVVEHIQDHAEVTFEAGTLSGTDSGGDTPSGVTATGGTIT